ncbi:GMC oxidoreductase-domain-containing protein [Trametes elegans]|nr:GMC oxidoreductase-domain-containing protein [Trametes elegans]
MQTRLISSITLATTMSSSALDGGGTIAARLSEDRKVNVLVIDAGARADIDIDVQVPLHAHRLQPDSPNDWNYTTVAQRGLNDRKLPYSHGKAVGGTSILNWMYWVRGPRGDYDKFAAVKGDRHWSWTALQHLSKKNERFVSPRDHHNTAGEIYPDIRGKHGAVQISVPGATFPTNDPTVAASKELGGEFQLIEGYNCGNPLGLGWFQGAYGGGKRRDSANSYIDPALSRWNLDVLIQTQVTKLVRTDTKENVPVIRGVKIAQCRSASGYTLTSNREVILSAGAIKTPRLLLPSGISASAQLAAHDIRTIVDLPDVGQHLADHPVIPLPYRTVSAADDIFTNLARNATLFDATLAEWKMRRQGVATNSDTNHIAFLRPSQNDPMFSTQPGPASGPTAPHTKFFVIPGTCQFLGPVPPEGM